MTDSFILARMRLRHLIAKTAAIGLIAIGGVVATSAPAAAATYYTCSNTQAPNPYLPSLYVTVCLEHFGYNGSPVRAYGWVTSFHTVATVSIQVSLTGATATGSATCSKVLTYGQTLACTGLGWGLPSPIAKGKLRMGSTAPGQPLRFHTVYSPQRT